MGHKNYYTNSYSRFYVLHSHSEFLFVVQGLEPASVERLPTLTSRKPAVRADFAGIAFVQSVSPGKETDIHLIIRMPIKAG